ncbi:hypothetical protein Tco_1432352 [Tanacetum coccineum]
MSSSTVTYTYISFDSDLPLWGFHLMDPDEFEAPQSLEQAPPSPDYVPGLEYPEYVALSDNEIPVEDQPLPADASPTALSSDYVTNFDPLEEVPKEDHKEDPAEYPADGRDEEEEEDESSEDDNDEEEEASKEDKEEEEEHLAPTDSTAPPVIDPVPSAKEIEPFETDESADTPPPPRSPHTRYASAPTPPSPPPSPLLPLSSPLPRISSPPLHTSPTYASAPLGYRAAMVYNIPETDMPFRKSYVSLLPLLASESRVMTVVKEVNETVTDLAITQRQDAHELYAVYAQHAWSRSEDRSTDLEARTIALEAQTKALQRDVSVL